MRGNIEVKLRDPKYWLPLTTEASSRNLASLFFSRVCSVAFSYESKSVSTCRKKLLWNVYSCTKHDLSRPICCNYSAHARPGLNVVDIVVRRLWQAVLVVA